MALYTVHVPDDVADWVTRADRTAFVREGFNVWGFVFGWMFLLWHRVWVAAAAWLALGCVVGAGAWLLHPPAASVLALVGLMHLFVGVEGNDLRRWRLERRRFRLADVVSGSRREDAERGFFNRQPDAAPPSPPPASRVVNRDTTPAVIGMFPDESGS